MLESGRVVIAPFSFDVIPGLVSDVLVVQMRGEEKLRIHEITREYYGKQLVVLAVREDANKSSITLTDYVAVSTDLGGKALPIRIDYLNIVRNGEILKNSSQEIVDAVQERFDSVAVEEKVAA